MTGFPRVCSGFRASCFLWMVRVALMFALAAAQLRCATVPQVDRATVVEVGSFEVTAAAFLSRDPLSFGAPYLLPGLQLAGRTGVGDGLDVGLGLSTSQGVSASAKVQLVRTGYLAVAFTPAIATWLPVNRTSSASVSLPVGLLSSGGHELVLTPRVGLLGYDYSEVGLIRFGGQVG